MNATDDGKGVICPVCGAQAGAYCVPAGKHWVYKCPQCGLEYTYPNPTDQELGAFYADYHDIRARQDVVTLNAKRNLELLAAFGLKETSTILDFGAGHGDFVAVSGPNCFGLELGAPQAERVYADARQLPVERFDFITLWGVLEHLNDIRPTIKWLSERLAEHGKILITTVDAEGLIPYYYKPIEHLTYWTEKAFRIMFEHVGMKIVHKAPYTMVQASEVYADRLLSRTPEQYRPQFMAAVDMLPEFVEVPTNETLVIAEKSR